MNVLGRTIAEHANDRNLRLVGLVFAAFVFLVAQTLFAAHASTPVEDLKGHSAAECAICFSGGVAEAAAPGAPAIVMPVSRLDAEKTAVPTALLTEIAVNAASPRGPPLV